MKESLIALYVISFVFPTWALSRYVIRASRHLAEVEKQSRERGHEGTTYDDVDTAYKGSRVVAARFERRTYLLDVALIGTGTACGALASILALQ